MVVVDGNWFDWGVHLVGGRGLEVLVHRSVATKSSYITEPNLNNFPACCGFILSKHP